MHSIQYIEHYPFNINDERIESKLTELVQKNYGKTHFVDVTYTWDEGFRLVGSGILTNLHVQGMWLGFVIAGSA